MKRQIGKILITAAAITFVGCDGSTDNPATVERDELQSPLFLYTVTGEDSIKVRWTAGNFEEDFKGYYVFATKKSISELTSLVKYPSTSVDITKSGIPRCADNSAFFEAFGLPASETDCEGAEEESSSGGSDSESFQGLQDEDSSSSGETATEDKLANYLQCTGQADAAPSLPAEAPTSGYQECEIKKAYDGTELADIAAGEVLTIFAVAVMNDDLDKISWTSNVVEDAGSLEVFKDDISISANKKFVTIDFDFTSGITATVSSEADCGDTTANPECYVSKQNVNTSKTSSIFLARDGGGTYTQRIHASTPANSNIKILARGPQNYDADKDESTDRAPGDEPVEESTSSSVYVSNGTTQVVYGNQVFDLYIDNSGDKHYGKLVVNSISYASEALTSASTVNVTVIVQPKAGVLHYLND